MPSFSFFSFFSCFERLSRHDESHTRIRALSRTPSKVSEVAPGSNVYPPFPQEKDPYLKARTHEMIQLFDLCHVLPFYPVSRRWGDGSLTASAFTQFSHDYSILNRKNLSIFHRVLFAHVTSPGIVDFEL